MRKLISNTALVAIAAGGMLFASCSDHDMFNPNYKAEEYAANWENKIGAVDPNQDWSMATSVTASINVAAAGNGVMTIYSSNPGNEDSKVLTKTVLENGTANVPFDAVKGQTNVYVVVNSSNGTIINGYYPIVNGKVSINNTTRATRAAGGETLGRTLTLSPVKHPNEGQWGWGFRPSIELQFINNVSKTTVSGWTLGDWEKIVGKPNGKFAEGQPNKFLYQELQNDDVVFTMAENGPVSVRNMYGATDYYNRFGYFYYTGDPSTVDLTKVKKYVIMDNASVHNNISINGNAVSKCELATIIAQLDNHSQHTRDEIVSGSEYKLVYWGADGNSEPSYIFPKGTKIGFFIHKIAQDANADANTIAKNEQYQNEGEAKLMFSQKRLNAYYNLYATENYQSKYDANNPEENGDWTCVTYRYGNTTLVGFEDGTDNDMNDIMWFMDGDFEETEDLPQMGEEPKEEYQSWILACEDLGSTDDYDFNDIVLEVKKTVNTEDITTNGTVTGTNFKKATLQVRCLAAGGTYQANISYDNGRVSVGESHALLGRPGSSDMLNTKTLDCPFSEWITLEETTDEKEWGNIQNANSWSIDNIAGKIQIVVTDDDNKTGNAALISAPTQGEAPQMIIVPGDWLWPTERAHIEEVYPDFKTWNSNASLTDWNANKVADKLIKR